MLVVAPLSEAVGGLACYLNLAQFASRYSVGRLCVSFVENIATTFLNLVLVTSTFIRVIGGIPR